jgi:hypothetical protein
LPISEKESDVELKEFVSTALSQIIEGVAAAQTVAAAQGAAVNPAFSLTSASGHTLIGSTSEGAKVTSVSFDVAVTAAETTGAQGGGKVQVAGLLSIGGGADTQVKSERVTRIQFSVPVCMPEDTATREALNAKNRERDAQFSQPISAAPRRS